ncbi:hypothetical protein [Celerinatantimonas diazotrophica]|uniref:Uncharacterized protein n=1 Tax=Celerinatantimonas diazotrophica TaxID=412034 RepID=A0A4R1J8N5_9GAMM|nr:hypothetical protein [Celerinatantimonas diazotrophica]TCK46953.1 hypothetical protein EV690_3105 [Celerinatantimonas diazotrophica]CAG9295721.1 hypothetical protein CEDIAZO_00847 [Celerinatantimonas diazotrophica]
MLSIRLKLTQWLIDGLLDYQDRLQTRQWLKQMRKNQISIGDGMNPHLRRDIGISQSVVYKADEPKKPRRTDVVKTQGRRRQMTISGRMQNVNWPPTSRRRLLRQRVIR